MQVHMIHMILLNVMWRDLQFVTMVIGRIIEHFPNGNSDLSYRIFRVIFVENFPILLIHSVGVFP
jgi:hypothetical protein